MRAVWLMGCLCIGACSTDDVLLLSSPIVRLSGSESTTCGINRDGELLCWGHYAPRAEWDYQVDEPTVFGRGWRDVAAGPNHACAIREDGTVWCWGRNCGGQLGASTPESSLEPLQVGTATNWTQIAVGGGKSCAIDDAGAMACWGGLDYGQTPCPVTSDLAPTVIAGTWASVSLSWYATHVLDLEGRLFRAEDTPDEQTPFTITPTEPMPGSTTRWRAIASGLDGSCGIRDDGSWACINDDTNAVRSIAAGTGWRTTASRDHHCALDATYRVWCFGRNDTKQSDPDSSELEIVTPRMIDDGPWQHLTVGAAGTCVASGRKLKCWGGAPGD